MSTPPAWVLADYKKALTANGRLLPRLERRLMQDSLEKNAKRDTAHLHPSEISKKDWCPRSSWYAIKYQEAKQESYNFQRLNIFAEGNTIHDKWQGWLWKEGILQGNWFCKACRTKWWDTSPQTCQECGSPFLDYAEVSIQNEEHMIIGHADGLIADDRGSALIEIKSVGLGTLRFDAPEILMPYNKGRISLDELWKSIKKPFPSHMRQINLYMYCTGIHDAVVIYEFKPTQAVKEFEIRYRPESVEQVLAGCLTVKKALEGGTSPMRPIWAESPASAGCKSCPFNQRCWGTEDDESNQVVQVRGSGAGEVSGEVQPATEALSGGSGTATGPGRIVRR
jgi:CRISPR/Cas system-associated exonuclease Cas4 (RecB family)